MSDIDLINLCRELKEKSLVYCSNLSQGSLNNGNVVVDKGDLSGYWTTLNGLCIKLGHECSKVSMIFQEQSNPEPLHYRSLLQTLESTVSAFYEQTLCVNILGGIFLQKQVKTAGVQTLSAFNAWIDSLIHHLSNGSQEYLIAVGKVWEAVEAVKSCPKSNKDSILILINKEYPLVCDALDEVVEDLNTYEENSEEIPTQNILNDLINFIKTGKSLLKKIKIAISNCEVLNSVKVADDLGNCITRMSSEIDEIIVDVGPPLDKLEICSKIDSFRSTLTSLLFLAKTGEFTTEDDINWIEFLSKATSHSYNKVIKRLKEFDDA